MSFSSHTQALIPHNTCSKAIFHHLTTQNQNSCEWDWTYLCVMLETEARKQSIFFDTSSKPFLKKLICKIKDNTEPLCTILHMHVAAHMPIDWAFIKKDEIVHFFKAKSGLMRNHFPLF